MSKNKFSGTRWHSTNQEIASKACISKIPIVDSILGQLNPVQSFQQNLKKSMQFLYLWMDAFPPAILTSSFK